MTTTRSVDQVVGAYPARVQELTSGARSLIRNVLPKVEETVDPSAGVLSFGYGPGYKGMVCTLILSKSGVKLGLVRGSELPDPRGLLEGKGKGKVHRHVRLESPADLGKPGLTELIKSADAAWNGRNGS